MTKVYGIHMYILCQFSEHALFRISILLHDKIKQKVPLLSTWKMSRNGQILWKIMKKKINKNIAKYLCKEIKEFIEKSSSKRKNK